jgi:hypothetical protein
MSDIIAAAAPAPNCAPCLHRVDESTSQAHTLIEFTDFLIVLSPLCSNGAQAGGIDDNAVPHNPEWSASATSHFRGRAPPVGWSSVHSRSGLPGR